MSHEQSATIGIQGGFVNVATVLDGRKVADREIEDLVRQGRLKPLGGQVFDTEAAALEAATRRSAAFDRVQAEAPAPELNVLALKSPKEQAAEAAARAPETSLRSVLGAAFRMQNTIASLSNRVELAPASDPDFDPFASIEGYEPYAMAFSFADTPQEVDLIKAKIDRELADRATLDAAGIGGFAAELAAGVLDPVNLIPIGGAAVKTVKLGRSVLRGGLLTARAGFLASTASELALQASQETRSLGESAVNVAGGTLLAGLLGAALPVVLPGGRAAARAVSRRIERDLTAPEVPRADAFEPGSVSIRDDELAADLAAARQRAGIDQPVAAEGRERGAPGGPAAEGAPAARRAIPEGDRVTPEEAARMAHSGPEKATGEPPPAREIIEGADVYVRQRVFLDDLADLERVPTPARQGGELVISAEGRVLAGGDAARAALENGDLELNALVGFRNEARAAPEPGPGLAALERAPAEAGSVGAAAVNATTLLEERLKGALGSEKLFKFLTPMLRGLQSASIEARRAFQNLGESPFTFEKNALGIASPQAVETRIKLHTAKLGRSIETLDRLFVQHRTGQASKGAAARLAVQAKDLVRGAGGRLTFKQFREQVGRAMRRGDEHPIPEVAEAARFVRRELFDPLKEQAIEAGLLPPDVEVTTAVSYLTRVYNVQKIKAQRPSFVRIATDWLKATQGSAAARVERLRARASELAAARDRLDAQIEDARLGERTDRGKAKEDETNLIRLRARSREARIAAAQAERESRTIERRARRFAGRGEAAQGVNELINKLRRRGPRSAQPRTLSSFIRSIGGIKPVTPFFNARGELADVAGRGGLVNEKSGVLLDDAAQRAWESGYFSELGTAPEINDFVEALTDDFLKRVPRYHPDDLPLVEEIDALAELDKLFNELGIDLDKLSNDQAVAALNRKAFAPERLKELGVARTRAAKQREFAANRLRQILEDRGAIEQRIGTVKEAAGRSKAEVETLRARQVAVRTALEKAEKAIDQERIFATLNEQELEDIAQQTTDHILGTSDGRLPYEAVPLSRGPLKERTFNIPDEAIEDFLDSDIEQVARFYLRTMAPDVELARRFGRVDLRDQIQSISDDYNRLIDRAVSDKARSRLAQSKARDIGDLEGIRDRIRGSYAAPADPDHILTRTSRIVRQLNFLRLMGGVTIASLPDLARPVMVHGINRTLRYGLAPLVTNLRKTRLAAAETKLAGTAWDLVLNSRALSLADLGDEFGRRSGFERGLTSASNNFGLLSLIAPWNTALKQFSGLITSSRILAAARGVADGTIAPSEILKLAESGIDDGMARKIAAQFATHGERESDLFIPNTEAWTDREAVRFFRSAVVRDTDRTIVTPTAGDRPLWMSSELGKVIGQFRSFSFSSTSQVLIAGLQQRDLATLNGALLSAALGMGVYYFKSGLGGFETDDDPLTWIREGVDRSGITGILFDVNNIVEKGSRGTVGLNAVLGGPVSSRYASRNFVGAIAGPTLGLAEDVSKAVSGVLAGDVRQSDIRAIRRLLPYQNLFYIRALFDAAERGIAKSLGVPK